MTGSPLDSTPGVGRQDGPAPGGFRHFDTLSALFVAVLLISNVASSKIVQFGPWPVDGGTLLFPLSYIFGDILTEVYGYRRSRRVIWTGFFSAFLMSVTFLVVGAMPAGGGWQGQEAWEAILGFTPRIVLASLVAYWAGEFANSYVLARMKVATEGRWLWTRTITSTLVGESLDTAIFVTVAFAGVLEPGVLREIFTANIVLKVGIEAAATPVTYAVVHRLKTSEGVDAYDVGVNFNPFSRSA